MGRDQGALSVEGVAHRFSKEGDHEVACLLSCHRRRFATLHASCRQRPVVRSRRGHCPGRGRHHHRQPQQCRVELLFLHRFPSRRERIHARSVRDGSTGSGLLVHVLLRPDRHHRGRGARRLPGSLHRRRDAGGLRRGLGHCRGQRGHQGLTGWFVAEPVRRLGIGRVG